ncbi:MAG TPA: hypothetical protein VLE99_03640 [Candidatus Saccharimonadales bacterium]|nr:hypothetical protein [Candidatus Saccharimonadales bacterium]
MKPVRRQALWRAKLVITLIFTGCLSLIASPALAINYGKGTYGACQFGACSISLSTSGSVALNVTPTGSGSCTIQKDIVTVTTSNSSGYTLSLTNSSTNTALLNGANSLAASSGTQASPTALSANKWGYRVDGAGGFGAGPTNAQTNVSVPATTFAGVPASNGTPSTLATTNTSAGTGSATSVWYGVCANTNQPSGTYTTAVTYTAVAN